ncbi:MAG TPA: nitroreductase family protein [Methanospirillum sp.]|nr:nitroreductase family protein [Methanospirillum sp.]
MNNPDFEERNRIFDAIISERRTHRKFTDETVPDSTIMEIIHAGLHAPYAGAAVSGSSEYFRKFFVIRKDSETMKALKPFIFHEVEEMATELEKAAARNEDFADLAGGFIKRLAMIRKMGSVPGVGTAPFYIVIAEKKGFPPVEQASLAHCLENMWLKATALGLGFQLVSITAQMDRIEEFCQIFDLRTGGWGFMGCAIGYPAEGISDSIRPDVKEVTTWLP